MPNRLSRETSPYLRQHADNPVDWYPWGEEAFARARSEDKPILLSIGYSACHWCHVMAHESFEDAETAAQMNRDFVNIKVDREEHPDVDQLYQHALQLLEEHGGWPLTMFLLPTGEPIFGGTYFPPRDAYNRPSFRRVLSGISQMYADERGKIVRQAEKMKETLGYFEARGAGGEATSRVVRDLVQRVASRLATRMDRREGGFEGAPKFPNPTALNLLLRAFGRSGDKDDVAPALLQLTKMASGGIYDQLGGGFARYSTDAKWLVPHFEKMLYDNAQLLRLYAEAHHIVAGLNQPRLADLYRRVIDETAGWMEREMRDPAGGLYAALDADSEGVEGKFYVWTPEEVERLAGPEQAAVFCRVYDVRPGGNWNDPHGHGPQGASVLHVVDTPNTRAEAELLVQACEALMVAREERVRPGTDDKVLTAWNGLAISGLAEAGRLLGEPRLIDQARRTADFVLEELRGPDGALLRAWAKGTAKFPATLDDHAFFAEGLFYLAGATGEARYLGESLRLTEESLRRFHDPDRHLFYVGPQETSGVQLVQRPVSLIDSAVPSGLSVTLMNMLRLSALSDVARARFWPIAEELLLRQADQAQKQPFGLSNLIAALDLWQNGLTVTVIIDAAPAGQGGARSEGAEALRKAASSVFRPDHFVWVAAEGEALPAEFAGLTADKKAQGGRATAYICIGTRCTSPITEAAELRERLSRPGDVM